MGELWHNIDEKNDPDKEDDPTTNKKSDLSFFVVVYSRYLSAYIHRVIYNLNIPYYIMDSNKFVLP